MTDETKADGGPAPAGFGPSFVLQPPSLHRIRLGPPWDVAPVAGGARHARKFGRPRALAADERVWLVCAHVPAAGEVRVNAAGVGTLDAPGPFAADVTPLLRPRNEVLISVASDQPLGPVSLEIRPA
ncbi:MAG: hypothetical protein ACKODX_02990 [Gemmata sp.]|jgi:hypothetical protein